MAKSGRQNAPRDRKRPYFPPPPCQPTPPRHPDPPRPSGPGDSSFPDPRKLLDALTRKKK